MSTLSNLPDVPDSNISLVTYDVPSDLYNVVSGWFGGKGFSKTSASLLASVLIASVIDAGGTQIEVLDILKKYDKVDSVELNDLISYLLNNSRVSTSYVGYETITGSGRLFNRLVL